MWSCWQKAIPCTQHRPRAKLQPSMFTHGLFVSALCLISQVCLPFFLLFHPSLHRQISTTGLTFSPNPFFFLISLSISKVIQAILKDSNNIEDPKMKSKIFLHPWLLGGKSGVVVMKHGQEFLILLPLKGTVYILGVDLQRLPPLQNHRSDSALPRLRHRRPCSTSLVHPTLPWSHELLFEDSASLR